MKAISLSIRSLRILSVLLAGIVLAAAARPAGAECARYGVIASGRPVHFLYAKRGERSPEEEARLAWEHLVAWQYGKDFADWKKARNGKIECRMPSRSYTLCTATAIPCDGRERR